MMAYCFFPHAEEKEMFVAEVGTVTQMCSFITSCVLLVVCRHGSFLWFEKASVFLSPVHFQNHHSL